MTGLPASAESRPRIVLLGASNLTRGISTVVGMALKCIAGNGADRASVLVAMGHGRSFGMRSRVLGRGLPGILESGLWNALRDAPPGPTYALLTDVGNDIAYGVPDATILEWVGACLDRLSAHGARIAMSRLPVSALERMGPARFRILKTLLFPRHEITLDAALASVRRVDEGLHELGERYGLQPFVPPQHWYGIDPLHPRRRWLTAGFQRMLAAWNGTQPPLPPRSPARWARLRTATAERWWLLGRERGRPQPLGELPGGSSLGVY